MGNAELTKLLYDVEAAIDAIPELTRVQRSGWIEIAKISFDGHGWTVSVNVRNKQAKGRGSRGSYSAHGDGETPQEAVSCFLRRLPYFVEATS